MMSCSLKYGLLGYKLRAISASEMLYGGIRVQYLNQSPPPIHFSKSEEIPLPDLTSEENDMELEYQHLGQRLCPLNIGNRARTEMIIIRNQDILKRYNNRVSYLNPQNQTYLFKPDIGSQLKDTEDVSLGNKIFPLIMDSRRFFIHPRSSDLQIFPTNSHTKEKGENTWPSWRPLQMAKPMGSRWSPALRSAGIRNPRMQLMQERLDRKGFGWKKKARSLWQQDIHTAGFRPSRFF